MKQLEIATTVILIGIALSMLLQGCSIKFCNCLTEEDKVKTVDRNSTNVELNLIPKGY